MLPLLPRLPSPSPHSPAGRFCCASRARRRCIILPRTHLFLRPLKSSSIGTASASRPRLLPRRARRELTRLECQLRRLLFPRRAPLDADVNHTMLSRRLVSAAFPSMSRAFSAKGECLPFVVLPPSQRCSACFTARPPSPPLSQSCAAASALLCCARTKRAAALRCKHSSYSCSLRVVVQHAAVRGRPRSVTRIRVYRQPPLRLATAR